MSKEYSRESIAHALAHHEGRGALLHVSPPEPGGRATWRVVLAKFPFDPKLLTEPQAYALCLGLAASEDHARIEHERFVHELAAFTGEETPPCVDEQPESLIELLAAALLAAVDADRSGPYPTAPGIPVVQEALAAVERRALA